MKKEEFLKEIENVPKINSINLISAYNSINVEDLANAVERFNKIPNYEELLKENQELKKQLEENKDKINWYENFEINKTIDKLRIKHNNQQKEFIEYLEDLIKQNETVVEVSKYGLPKNCSKLLIDFYKEILSKYREIIGSDINVGSIGDKDE